MSLLFSSPNYAALGQLLVKQALSSPQATYAMAGKLYLSASGWLLLAVPNDLVRGVFNSLHEIGVELPPGKDGQPFNAHVSVMRADEVAAIGDAKITERGQLFHYNIGRLATVNPAGWDDISKCWLLQVQSPELMQLRRSYGLPSLPQRNGETIGFHISVAVRRKNVLRENEVSKVSFDINGFHEQLAAARKDTNTEPTEAQREAGNYAKGKLKLHGLDISLENPKGSTRSGTSPDGKAWSITLKHDYGYIRGTTGADSDHVDCFIGPDPASELVHVVNQVDPTTGSFDEVKVMLGYTSEAAARDGYLANYEDGWQGLGEITAATLSQFKAWLSDGDTSLPFRAQTGETRTAKAAGVPSLVADERAMLQSQQPTLSGIWPARDSRMQAMAEQLCDIPTGHGKTARVGAGVAARTPGQQSWLFAGQLPLGDLPPAAEKQAQQHLGDLRRADHDPQGLGLALGCALSFLADTSSRRLAAGKNANYADGRVGTAARMERATNDATSLGQGTGHQACDPEKQATPGMVRRADADDAGRLKTLEKQLVAGIKTTEMYDPICPHCDEVMGEKSFVPDREHPGQVYRHRGECYDKGPFKIVWPDQEKRDAEYETFRKRYNLDKQSADARIADLIARGHGKKIFSCGHTQTCRCSSKVHGIELAVQHIDEPCYTCKEDAEKAATSTVDLADDAYWDSPPNKEGRRCNGCGELFKECEPLPNVTMCEVCERFGPAK